MDGIVKWFSKEKGYGYISALDTDHFFHVSQVKGLELPSNGDLVTFTTVTGKNGKPAASDVVITEQKRKESRKIESEKPYYGSPTYTYTYETKDGTRLGSAMWLGAICAAIALGVDGGLAGSLAGFVIGAIIGWKLGKKEETITTSHAITRTCLRCGGTGQVTAEAGGKIGFQCEKCKHFWKERI